MSIDTKTLRLAEATYRDRAHHATADLLRDAADTIDAQAAEIERLREVLKMMIRAYVNLLECGRDRIIALGGQCDPVDVMEASTPELIAARAALQGESHE
jgi:hypothetical protein